MGEDDHLQAKAKHVRIDDGQIGVRTQPRQLKEISELVAINAVLTPTCDDWREAPHPV